MSVLAGIPVRQDAWARADRLFTLVPAGLYPPSGLVLVHPSRWEEFFMSVNQPDVATCPAVREALGWSP
jgi:hypothetical protein